DFDYLGADGIFGGMIIAIIFSGLFVFFNKKGLVVKLPESVPPKVAESMSPTFIALIIFTYVFLIRVAFSFTEYGDYFTAINTVIGSPILKLGANPTSAFIFMVLISACWFFGIHPNVVLSMFLPVLMTTGTANLNEFMGGEAMHYFTFTTAIIVYYLVGYGVTHCISV